MRRVSVTHAARRDIDAIFKYIANSSVTAARKVTAKFTSRTKLLATSATPGELRADIGPNVRQTIVDEYLLFYEVDDQRIVLLRVIHGARQMPDAFFDNP